jgi:hypothetical protein
VFVSRPMETFVMQREVRPACPQQGPLLFLAAEHQPFGELRIPADERLGHHHEMTRQF